MKKLNKKKIRWVVREMEKREVGAWTIAQQQEISVQHTYKVFRKYGNSKNPVLLKPGRKPKEISKQERQLVVQTYKEYLVGATMIEQILDEKGIHINHNRIHRILLEEGLAKEERQKKKRRSWVRYERKHSLILGHGDWFVFKGKDVLVIIDDASRFVPHCKEYKGATIENSKRGFKASLKSGLWKQFMTDHGSHFVSNEREGCKTGDSLSLSC